MAARSEKISTGTELEAKLTAAAGEMHHLPRSGRTDRKQKIRYTHRRASGFLLRQFRVADLADIDYADETGDIVPFGYLFACALLIVIEMPLATMLTTIFLGQVTFMKQPGAKPIAITPSSEFATNRASGAGCWGAD